MIGVFDRWYKRKFSDPDAMMLLMLLVVASLLLLLWGDMLMPVLVALIIAYLLDWPVLRLSRVGMSRGSATSVVLLLFIGICTLMFFSLVPIVWQQTVNLLAEMPDIWAEGRAWAMTLPERYPDLVEGEQIDKMLTDFNQKAVSAGENLIQASFSSIVSLVAVLVYAILVPLLVFFMLKDKQVLVDNVSTLLPKERRLIKQVGSEMNNQILNYIRGKVIEIIIVGTVSAITFAVLDLRYALLLGVLVGFSVLIPYIGAAVVTFPIFVVAVFQWGISPPFWYVMVAYGIIQALDGNVLVPVLFSEAVSLHPVYIIVAVLFFGGLWGFWGVFFAIPLATLVKAVINAWSDSPLPDPDSSQSA